MATQTISEKLVDLLRQKIGDNPTKPGAIEGSLVPDTSLQVWSDDELLNELTMSLATVYKGKIPSIEMCNAIQQIIILLHARIELATVLSINSARYAKYNMREANIERLPPSEWVNIARYLTVTLSKLIDDSGDDLAVSNVTQSVMFKKDDRTGANEPYEFNKAPDKGKINFSLAYDATAHTITLTLLLGFFPDFSALYIQKIVDDTVNLFASETDLSQTEFIDANVTPGKTYGYNVIVENYNGVQSSVKKSISI